MSERGEDPRSGYATVDERDRQTFAGDAVPADGGRADDQLVEDHGGDDRAADGGELAELVGGRETDTPLGDTGERVPPEQRRGNYPPSRAGELETPEVGRLPDDGVELEERTTERRKKVPSVQLSPLEAAAAAELAEEEAARRAGEPITQVVPKPRLRPLRHECRFCGTRVSEPQATRALARPVQQGFRCDTCNNIYCGKHVVRSTGLFRSLLSGSRHRCVLCVDPDSMV